MNVNKINFSHLNTYININLFILWLLFDFVYFIIKACQTPANATALKYNEVTCSGVCVSYLNPNDGLSNRIEFKFVSLN